MTLSTGSEFQTGSEFRSTAAIIQPVRKLGTAAVAWQTGSDRRREYRGGSTLSFCNAAIDGREVSLWVKSGHHI
jgi:hypothetical protein